MTPKIHSINNLQNIIHNYEIAYLSFVALESLNCLAAQFWGCIYQDENTFLEILLAL